MFLFPGVASFTSRSVKKSMFEFHKGKLREARSLHRGARIVRCARGDNLQEMAEMDWQSMFFSPIEKSPFGRGTVCFISLSQRFQPVPGRTPTD